MILLLPVIFGTVILVFMFHHFFLLAYKHDPKSLPSGKMGFPFVGEAFGFFTPHKSFSIGNFLQQHRSRYIYFNFMQNFQFKFSYVVNLICSDVKTGHVGSNLIEMGRVN